MNRKHLILTTAAALFASSAMIAVAGPFVGHGNSPGLGADHIEARLERMSDQLDLTDAQQAQLRTILEQQQANRDRARQQTRAEIDALLTDAQRAQRDAELEKRQDRRLARMSDRLDLSETQQDALRDLFEERRNDPDLTREQMRERLAAVLDDDQLAALEQGRGRRGMDSGRDCRRR
jgi:Spy/CpxP family protein refolding chaperone